MEIIPEFEYDEFKSEANLAKHGVDFEQAQNLWLETIFAEGPVLSPVEQRWMRVAQMDEKLWSAVFTVRESKIRIISVRRSRPNEVLAYEQQTALR